MGDMPYAEALCQARQRLNELLNGLGDADDPTGLIATSRELVAHLDEAIRFLTPGNPEDEERFEKAYASVVGYDENAVKDAEVAEMIAELEREANEAILFLENVDLEVGTALAFMREDTAGQCKMLISQRALQEQLSRENEALQNTIDENETELAKLDQEIATLSAEVERLSEVAANPDTRGQKSPYPSGVGLYDVSSLDKVDYSITAASWLLSALEASPLKVVEEGDDYIVYEYTLEGTSRKLRVQDSASGGISFTLDPMDAKAHAYLTEHLKNCKSRIQIAAVLQEALSLP